MKLYYTVADNYPPFRVDLAELYGVELAQLGVETEWYTDAPLKATHQSVDFRAHHPRFSKSGLVRKLKYWGLDVAHLLAQLFRATDAIQARDKYIGAVVGLGVARLKRVPFYYWCSYPFPEHYALRARGEQGLKRLYSLAHSAIGRWALYRVVMPRADHVFVQSAQMARDFEVLGIPLQKMTPVPMGVSPRLLEWANANPRPVVPGKIVYLGTLAEVRRLDDIVRAFALVCRRDERAHLWMVGDGDQPSDRKTLQTLCESLGVAARVTFTGFVPMDEAWAHAAEAAVCLSPFFPTPVLAVASPTKLVEYMALGRPIVCNDHPEQTEVAAASGAAVCVPWGVSEFAEAMMGLLAEPEKAEAIGSNGPEWVRANRTYPQIAARVREVYATVGRRG
jgi:glycosyltransferase involved in cell wall biosynthesis